jgi:hypothetical protein
VTVLTDSSFGLTIAYLLPGFTMLCGVAVVSPAVRTWLGASAANAPSLGGFLYVTIGSLTAGLILSAIRWLLLDTLHHRTGLTLPPRDFSKLQSRLLAFNNLVADHYRFYQFYGSMLFASAIAYGLWRFQDGAQSPLIAADIGFVLLEVVLFAGSRDTLRKYYDRTRQLLGTGKRRLRA